jgi:hypothetical protein
MYLAEEPADARLVTSDDDKEVFNDEPPWSSQLIDDLHVGQALLVGTDLVLALDDVDAFGAKDAPSFVGC